MNDHVQFFRTAASYKSNLIRLELVSTPSCSLSNCFALIAHSKVANDYMNTAQMGETSAFYHVWAWS